MGDIHELLLAMDLRADIADDALAELRWHLGQGPRPGALPIGSDRHVETFPLGDPTDPDCEWEEAEPEPMFAGKGAARLVGGVVFAELVRRQEPEGWALTVRQELHPDAFDQLETLLSWLGPQTRHAGTDGVVEFVGYLRYYESAEAIPLILSDGRISCRALDPPPVGVAGR